MIAVTAIFDIGKTNKKCFLFDEQYAEVYSEYADIPEIVDEDDYPCDDLLKIIEWIQAVMNRLMRSTKYAVQSVNFSTYGASFVHLDQNGNPVAPLYNYLKPVDEKVLSAFFEKYGDKATLSATTASPFLALLNSGLQLYWLKHQKPETFQKISYSLHLPQYLSFVFTGKMYSEYTSIGCHTMLWDYDLKKYHTWVEQEQLDQLFAPIVSTQQTVLKTIKAHSVKFGIGIHDSSAALIPYLQFSDEPFVLISTGTWSISLNPFGSDVISKEDLQNDCLNFMQMNGKPVRASRLFLGHYFDETVKKLADYFEVDQETHKEICWDDHFSSQREQKEILLFNHAVLNPERFGFTNNLAPDYSRFSSFDDALMHLLDELTDIQIASMKLAQGDTPIQRVFVDGGFGGSEVFVRFLAQKLEPVEVIKSILPTGSALGAALAVNQTELPCDFYQQHFKKEILIPTL